MEARETALLGAEPREEANVGANLEIVPLEWRVETEDFEVASLGGLAGGKGHLGHVFPLMPIKMVELGRGEIDRAIKASARTASVIAEEDAPARIARKECPVCAEG